MTLSKIQRAFPFCHSEPQAKNLMPLSLKSVSRMSSPVLSTGEGGVARLLRSFRKSRDARVRVRRPSQRQLNKQINLTPDPVPKMEGEPEKRATA